jgi:carboxypeptidase family protein
MTRLRWIRCAAAAAVLAVSSIVAAAPASAQGTSAAAITGVVKDASGGVMPGVTVEAASPALIEKIRTTVTDEKGQYRIIELLPGTYTVSFALAGFSTLTRSGLELTSNFTATVNADLKVGELAENVTVSAAAPLVDVTKVTQQKVITSDDFSALPTAKSSLSLMAFMPAAAAPTGAQDVGGGKGETSVRMSIHGGRQSDSRALLNGMSFNMLDNPTGRTFFMNPLGAAEIVVEAGSGGSAEYSTGGAQVNIITRDGGNRFSGTVAAAGTTHGLQSNNLTSDLQAQGFTTPNNIQHIYDLNVVVGGPILADSLWFNTAHRRNGRQTQVANLFHDAILTDFVFTPDPNQPVFGTEDLHSDNLRLTWAATKKQKFNFSYDWQHNNSLNQGGELDAGNTAVEASARANAYCNQVNVWQGTWTYPVSDRFLVDAGLSAMNNYYSVGLGDMACGGMANNIQIREQSTGFTYNGTGIRQKNVADPLIMRASTSYLTGAHSYKAGFNLLMTRKYDDYRERGASLALPVTYTFNNGVPRSLTEFVTPRVNPAMVRPNLGIFFQDQWNMKRVTFNYGLRYEYLRAYAAAVTEPAGFPSNAVANYDQVDCLPCWHDLNPRGAVAWDLFGTGKTAVKAAVGRYVESLNSAYATSFGPSAAIVLNTTRAWTDTNRDFYPNCDLANPAANGECAAMANSSFGQLQYNTVPDAGFMTGFGKRQYNWQASVGVDHELRPGFAVSTAYYRRWFGNFTVTDNTLVTPADYDPYCVAAPVDARLGSVSGSEICGLYDINPAKFGQVSNVVGLASKFGAPTEIYNGVDVNLSARFGRGGSLQGGWNIGNTFVSGSAGGSTFSHTNNCFVVDSPQQLYNCESQNPYQSRIKLNGTYPLPWDLQMAAVYQNLPSANYGAAFTVSSAAIQPSLGRPLAGGTANVTFDLLPVGSSYLPDRINQFDFRLTKFLRLGGSRRLQANLDVFNMFNASTVLNMNTTYGPAWLKPSQILDARLVKVGVELAF